MYGLAITIVRFKGALLFDHDQLSIGIDQMTVARHRHDFNT